MPQITSDEILFILNPNSGKKKIDRIKKSINKLDPKISTIIPSNVKEANHIYKKYLERYTVFVVGGGDGTVNRAVRYLAGQNNKYLAVYPMGSGNGFARELGFKKDLRKLLNAILQGNFIELDVIHINKHLFVNCAGVGLDSYIAHEFGKSGKRGILRYFLLTFKAVIKFKSFEARVFVNDMEFKGLFRMVTFANTRQFGSNAIIAPMAKPDDGMLNIVLVKLFPFYLYPVLAIQLITGKLQPSRHVEYLKTNQPVSFFSDYKQFHTDGEPKSFHDQLEIRIHKGGLKVIQMPLSS